MNAPQLQDLTIDTIETALTYISPNKPRAEWARIGMALKHELGDAGFVVFDNWSRGGDSYDEKSARETWKSIHASGTRGSVTINTVIYEAQQAGFDLKEATRKTLTADEIEARRKQREADHAREEAERKRRQGEAAKMANLIMAESTPAGDDHPYLEAKRVRAHGLVYGKWPVFEAGTGEIKRWIPHTLLVPIIDTKNGKTISLQALVVDHECKASKYYLKDARKRGGYFMIGKVPEPGQVIAFCEGYATGATIHELTGWTVIVCFDAPNLSVVAESMREAFPLAAFVICADNDKWSATGDIENPGIHYAEKAAKSTHAHVIIPQFADDSTRPTDFNDLASLEGEEVARAQLVAHQIITPIAAAPKPANDNQPQDPFRVLGYDHGEYFIFQHEKNQLMRWNKGDMTESGFLELAPADWWGMRFPKKNALFDKPAMVDWLFRQAAAAGIYDPSCVRGRGAWIDAGRTVFHFGTHLWVDGQSMPVSAIKSEYVYEKARRLPAPADKALTDDEGKNLVDIAKMFRWTKPASAALLAGFVALAPLCGALRWRPHVWITGGAGCGKTTVLNQYVHLLMGGLDIFAQGNSTEAGIRQKLCSDALPVLFDESEQNNEREASRVQNVLSLIRQASSESAAVTLKGTAAGEAMHFHVRSMFCLSSIQVGMKHQADFERLTVLALRPKREEADAAKGWKTLCEKLYSIERDSELPARLLRRSLDLLPTTVKNIHTFVEAATKKFGSAREGDQYGTLLAGCWSMMSSAEATPDQAAQLIDSYDWDEYRENIEADESMKALGALLEAQVRAPSGLTMTIYELVMSAANYMRSDYGISARDADLLLQRHGMRIADQDLLLSNNSMAITELLHGTPYAADIRGQLLRVPGVRRYEKSVRFNGVVSKCLALPVAAMVERQDGF